MIDGLTGLGWTRVAERFRPVRHHDAHAESALVPSGFDRALCVVSDGMGEIESLSVFRAVDGTLERLHTSRSRRRWASSTRSRPGSSASSSTTTSTRSWGSPPTATPSASARCSRSSPASTPTAARCHRLAARTASPTPSRATRTPARSWPRPTFTPRTPDGTIQRDEADFAAALQERLTTLLVELTSGTGSSAPVSGTCASPAGPSSTASPTSRSPRCRAWTRCSSSPPPATTAPRSARPGTSPAARAGGLAPVTGPFDPYLGPRYDPDEVRAALEARPDLRWTHVGETAEYFAAAAADIAADRIVAWFSGRMEFGPRALGNRSILARPDGDRIKERINGAVKFREAFRPFAPAVLDEDVDRLFVTRGFEPDRYMLCTAQVRPEARTVVEGIVHADDSARIQTVRDDLAPGFARAAARGQGPHRGRRRRQHVVQRQGPAADHGSRRPLSTPSPASPSTASTSRGSSSRPGPRPIDRPEPRSPGRQGEATTCSGERSRMTDRSRSTRRARSPRTCRRPTTSTRWPPPPAGARRPAARGCSSTPTTASPTRGWSSQTAIAATRAARPARRGPAGVHAPVHRGVDGVVAGVPARPRRCT